jgi:hypothetical protein
MQYALDSRSSLLNAVKSFRQQIHQRDLDSKKMHQDQLVVSADKFLFLFFNIP